jgi:hypothetical protein
MIDLWQGFCHKSGWLLIQVNIRIKIIIIIILKLDLEINWIQVQVTNRVGYLLYIYKKLKTWPYSSYRAGMSTQSELPCPRQELLVQDILKGNLLIKKKLTRIQSILSATLYLGDNDSLHPNRHTFKLTIILSWVNEFLNISWNTKCQITILPKRA